MPHGISTDRIVIHRHIGNPLLEVRVARPGDQLKETGPLAGMVMDRGDGAFTAISSGYPNTDFDGLDEAAIFVVARTGKDLA